MRCPLPTWVGQAHEHLLQQFQPGQDGVQFDETIMWGLARSLVAVPFVTADALARMCEADSEQCIDHVLLE